MKGLIFKELLQVEEALGKMGCFCPTVGSFEAVAGWIQRLCNFVILKATFFYTEKATEIKLRAVERVFANSQYASRPHPLKVKG